MLATHPSVCFDSYLIDLTSEAGFARILVRILLDLRPRGTRRGSTLETRLEEEKQDGNQEPEREIHP